MEVSKVGKMLLTILSFLLLSSVFFVTSLVEEQPVSEEQTEEVSFDIREVVWNQLSEEDKNRIDGNYETGKVSEVFLREGRGVESELKRYEGTKVLAIDFPVKGNMFPNNTIVYVDKLTIQYIGHGIVD